MLEDAINNKVKCLSINSIRNMQESCMKNTEILRRAEKKAIKNEITGEFIIIT